MGRWLSFCEGWGRWRALNPDIHPDSHSRDLAKNRVGSAREPPRRLKSGGSGRFQPGGEGLLWLVRE